MSRSTCPTREIRTCARYGMPSARRRSRAFVSSPDSADMSTRSRYGLYFAGSRATTSQFDRAVVGRRQVARVAPDPHVKQVVIVAPDTPASQHGHAAERATDSNGLHRVLCGSRACHPPVSDPSEVAGVDCARDRRRRDAPLLYDRMDATPSAPSRLPRLVITRRMPCAREAKRQEKTICGQGAIEKGRKFGIPTLYSRRSVESPPV